MGTTSRLSSASFAPAAEEPVEAPALGALCSGAGDTDGDGGPDGSEGDGEGDGFFVGLGDPAPPLVGAGAATPPPPPSPDGSTGDASPSGDVSGTLARRSSGSARSRSGASYENSPLANPAAAITPAAAVPARATISPVRRRRRPRGRPAEGAAVAEEGEKAEVKGVAGAAEVAGPERDRRPGDAPGAVAVVAAGAVVIGAVVVDAVVVGIAIVGVRSGPGTTGAPGVSECCEAPGGTSFSSPSST
ncbi:hypothetical protein RM704_28085 [Streptomyces sp. DSM 3412]|uniref:Uncharacterized protein n=1 Tax=Streptomyces gottesmaniae TaxID=3075518 RepID=A0ABU2Z4B5_9ACTN|nr:hypothetical protein [Streptomyces sp. DSM 3412]MDT0571276.1 hypothetical protein [Streptomyces sp. DSM 3412]